MKPGDATAVLVSNRDGVDHPSSVSGRVVDERTGCLSASGELAKWRADCAARATDIVGAQTSATMISHLTPDAAEAFIENSQFLWHQRFELAPGVYTPGTNDMGLFLDMADLPDDLHGASVLDIGTTNGGMAFELERRGASRVVAVDIYNAHRFGFAEIKQLLGSNVKYMQKTVYELPTVLSERFDIVLFLGVLYHLRHPLLALDVVRAVTCERAVIETAVCDGELGTAANVSIARFHRLDQLSGDSSNWFEPSVAMVTDWCMSSGLEPIDVRAWPETGPSRCMMTVIPTQSKPEYLEVSYELPLTCAIAGGHVLPG